jgi:hypothetical protein
MHNDVSTDYLYTHEISADTYQLYNKSTNKIKVSLAGVKDREEKKMKIGPSYI